MPWIARIHGDDFDNEITRRSQDDTEFWLYGHGGNDTLVVLGDVGLGSRLEGGDGDDYLQVGNAASTNFLSGGSGTDTMVGSAGNDRFMTDVATDVVVDESFDDEDWLLSSVWNSVLPDTIENFRGAVSASAPDRGVRAKGNDGDNRMMGSFRSDLLHGRAGDDELTGEGGNDTLIGGLGADVLEGYERVGGEMTTFRYDRIQESGRAFGWDKILDMHSDDRIDLSRIDADRSTKDANEDFVFVGTEAFGADATGQLRYEQVNETTVVVLVSTDADSAAEMRILLVSSVLPTVANFVL